MYYEQAEYDIRLEWGQKGIEALATSSDVVVIVDVLSFTTCVEIALWRGAAVFPFRGSYEMAEEFARSKNAILASKRGRAGAYSLAPSSLMTIPAGTKLVLPSPNGSRLTIESSKHCHTVAGCLRNSKAVADYLQNRFKKITVIPCGERWPDGTLRPSLEDLIGAGAIMSCLRGTKSPEALHAEMVYAALEDVTESVSRCSSGVELRERGYAEDVAIASEVNVSDCVPVYEGERYVPASG